MVFSKGPEGGDSVVLHSEDQVTFHGICEEDGNAFPCDIKDQTALHGKQTTEPCAGATLSKR